MALFRLVRELKYLRMLFAEIERVPRSTITFDTHVDNKSCIAMATNSLVTQRTKHIDVDYCFIREQLLEKVLTLGYVPSAENIADPLTKPTTASALARLCGR